MDRTSSRNRDRNSRFEAGGLLRAEEGKERTFQLSFSSEAPCRRWFGMEILDHGENAVDLDRLNEIGCVLFNHERDQVVGRVVSAWTENGRGLAEIVFDSDPAADVIFQKVQSGTLKGVSVGYSVDSWEEVAAGAVSADGRFSGPCSVARKWTPLEISIVSVPADDTVGVGREEEPVPAGDALSLAKAKIVLNENQTGA